MSKLIASAAIRASHVLFKRAEEMLEKATAEKGKDFIVELPDTAFYLPQIYAMTAFKVKTLADMKVALEMTREMLQDIPDEKLWRPYLGEALDSVPTRRSSDLQDSSQLLCCPSVVNNTVVRTSTHSLRYKSCD